jgi:hypothetical protein
MRHAFAVHRRHDIVRGLLGTIRIVPLLAALSSVRVPAAAAQQGCIQAHFDSTAVRLTGILRRHTYPGVPNFESVAKGDEAENGFYLHLDRGICAPATEEYEAARDVRLVQFDLDQAGYDRLRSRLGRRVTVEGSIFGAITGHHHAPVLMWLVRVHPWQLGAGARPTVHGRPQPAVTGP